MRAGALNMIAGGALSERIILCRSGHVMDGKQQFMFVIHNPSRVCSLLYNCY